MRCINECVSGCEFCPETPNFITDRDPGDETTAYEVVLTIALRFDTPQDAVRKAEFYRLYHRGYVGHSIEAT